MYGFRVACNVGYDRPFMIYFLFLHAPFVAPISVSIQQKHVIQYLSVLHSTYILSHSHKHTTIVVMDARRMSFPGAVFCLILFSSWIDVWRFLWILSGMFLPQYFWFRKTRFWTTPLPTSLGCRCRNDSLLDIRNAVRGPLWYRSVRICYFEATSYR